MNRLYIAGVAVVIATVGAVVLLTASRRTSLAKESTVRETDVANGPRVQIVPVEAGGGNRHLVLTGESRPYFAVTLYSKVSGYLTEVRVDKGDRVHKGEVLAVVESPETDAAFVSAQADAKNKRAIAERDAQLINRKLIAPEEAETAESDAAQAEAHAKALETLKGYEILKAPFDGVITARYADPGALMQNAQTSQTAALPVVGVGQTDSLRVFVYVDQANAADVQRGAPVVLSDASRPGQPIHARVSRYTGELDPQTRTLLAEIDVPNPKHDLLAGSIVQATLEVHGAPYVRVPAEAVFSRGLTNFVATVTSENRVAFREVHVVDNDGQTVRLAPGDLHPGDRVALNLGDSVPDGQRVQPLGEPAA